MCAGINRVIEFLAAVFKISSCIKHVALVLCKHHRLVIQSLAVQIRVSIHLCQEGFQSHPLPATAFCYFMFISINQVIEFLAVVFKISSIEYVASVMVQAS